MNCKEIMLPVNNIILLFGKGIVMEIYEPHTNIDPNLPVIFHYDIFNLGESISLHWHDGVEILYCTQGCGKIVIDSETYHIGAGDTFVVNSGCLHAISCISEENLKYYCLIPSEAFCESCGFDISETRYTVKIQNEYFKSIFENINDEYARKLPYYKIKIKAEIMNMFVCLSRNYKMHTNTDKISDSKKQMVKSAIKYIKKHYGEHMSIDDIAGNIGFSRYYLCHAFKEMMGMSLVNYINMLRCEKAKTHIYSRKYSISEIALMCGFENFSYFTKTYKKYMGVLPSDELKKQF